MLKVVFKDVWLDIFNMYFITEAFIAASALWPSNWVKVVEQQQRAYVARLEGCDWSVNWHIKLESIWSGRLIHLFVRMDAIVLIIGMFSVHWETDYVYLGLDPTMHCGQKWGNEHKPLLGMALNVLSNYWSAS